MKTAVITTARGRHRHLQLQLRGLTRCTPSPDIHVVVAMDDPAVGRIVAAIDSSVTVVASNTGDGAIRVAAARNLGARNAIDQGAELLIFLDVDCIPAPSMLNGYRNAAADPRHRRALLCGPVSYLPPPPAGGYRLSSLADLADPHPARPVPAPGQIIDSTDYHLFWSLSFAVTVPTWDLIGGFHAGYTGYGAEDTDFAQLAAAAGVAMRWVGSANAFHQHHPISDPPVEHLVPIVANANLFHRRWGFWPMSGWLREFADRGLIHWDSTRLQLASS